MLCTKAIFLLAGRLHFVRMFLFIAIFLCIMLYLSWPLTTTTTWGIHAHLMMNQSFLIPPSSTSKGCSFSLNSDYPFLVLYLALIPAGRLTVTSLVTFLAKYPGTLVLNGNKEVIFNNRNWLLCFIFLFRCWA